jgi:GNAT superfamily N-acetyltransferase
VTVAVRELAPDDVGLVALVDRSEHVDVEYEVVDGELTERPVTMGDVPPWDPVGDGPFSVAAHVAFCRDCVANGAQLLGAFDGDGELLGLAVVDADFEPALAWLAFLHVSRPHRRRGVASALWTAAEDAARTAGATAMYVSATPTGSAVGFYLRQGCRLADPVHPALYANEPDDIHLVKQLV